MTSCPMPNSQVIQTFYEAFQRKDAAEMARCYHPDAEFTDEVFVGMNAARVSAMWRMFCAPDGDLKVVFSNVAAEGDRGSGHWDATYTFSATGRPVVNRIDSSFEFKDGKIFRHRDRFDFYKWSRQALGVPGVLLGWTPMLRKTVQRKAQKALDTFIRDEGKA